MAEKSLSLVTLTLTTADPTQLKYRYKNIFEMQNDFFDNPNLIQQINLPTGQQVINNENKESILDHIYVQDPTIINDIYSIIPLIGDHKLIMCGIITRILPIDPIIYRNWHVYSKEKNFFKNF